MYVTIVGRISRRLGKRCPRQARKYAALIDRATACTTVTQVDQLLLQGFQFLDADCQLAEKDKY